MFKRVLIGDLCTKNKKGIVDNIDIYTNGASKNRTKLLRQAFLFS